MQNKEMAHKVRVFFDGIEIPGLVSVGEISREKGTVEVPSFSKIVIIANGITKMPMIELKYKTERNSNTRKFFRDWYKEETQKDMTFVYTDAHGIEYERIILSNCEIQKEVDPAYDGANPSYSQLTVTILPNDIIPLS